MLEKRDSYHVVWNWAQGSELAGTLYFADGRLCTDVWGRGPSSLNWAAPLVRLDGFTVEGYHLSAFDLRCRSLVQHKRGMEAEFYDDTVFIGSCFAGEEWLFEADPVIGRFCMRSDDLELLAFLLGAERGEGPILLFSNDFVCIELLVGESWSDSFMETIKRTLIELSFRFSEGVRLDWFRNNWLVPVVSLIELVSGGRIHPDCECFCLSDIDQWFCDIGAYAHGRDEGRTRYASSQLGFHGKKLFDLQMAISQWMEQCNPLRDICPFYSSLYSNRDLGDARFLTSMRLAEAAYATRRLRELSEVEPLNKYGVIDLGDPDFVAIKRKVHDIRNVKFAEKMEELIDAYGDLLVGDGDTGVDWGACVKAAVAFRNDQAHGLCSRKLTTIDCDQMFALTNMAILFYEACAIEGFALGDDAARSILRGVVKRNSYETNVLSVWGQRS